MLKSPLLLTALLLASSSHAADWPTFGHDPQRSGWAAEERTLSPANVGGLELKWKTRVKNESYSLSALTPPVAAGSVSTIKGIKNVAYVGGIGGTVFALETETGEVVWSRNLPTHTTPKPGGFQGTFLCPTALRRPRSSTAALKRSTKSPAMECSTASTSAAAIRASRPSNSCRRSQKC